MTEFKIYVDIFLCPPWMYGKIFFPLVAELRAVDGKLVISTGQPDLVSFDCIGRVNLIRGIVESAWGDGVSDEYIMSIASEKFAGEVRYISNYSPEFIEGTFENQLIKQATRMFSDYYPAKTRKQITGNTFMKAFEWSIVWAE